MSHIGDNYEKIDFLEKNKLFLKICINFLDDLESNFKGKEISIFLANAFIQSFLYIFVNYFYNNLNDNDNFDLNGVLKIIEGNSNFKRVVQIYFFKLLFNKIGNYDKFKLNIGKNIITWSGNIESIEIENFSRWI